MKKKKSTKGYKPDKKRAEARAKKNAGKWAGVSKKARAKGIKKRAKARAKGTKRYSSRKSGGKGVVGQVTAYKDDAIGGGIFGVASKTKLFDLVKLSPNPAGRELVGAAMAHIVGMYAPGDAGKIARDTAQAGVAVASYLFAKNSDVAARVAESVDTSLPEPFNDEFLIKE